MGNKEILAIYKIAEKHWSRPKWLCKIIGWNSTHEGLCWYLQCKHKLYYPWEYKDGLIVLDAPWIKYKTRQGFYHFYTRKERLQAIRNVIKDLENEQ
jgi:hypothetical protein